MNIETGAVTSLCSSNGNRRKKGNYACLECSRRDPAGCNSPCRTQKRPGNREEDKLHGDKGQV